MDEKKTPGKLIKAFHVGSKRVFANKFEGKNGEYYRINIQSSNFDDIKLFIFANEARDYLAMMQAIVDDSTGSAIAAPTTEALVEEPKPQIDSDVCERCHGLDFVIHPGRGTQCVNCGKIYWINNG